MPKHTGYKMTVKRATGATPMGVTAKTVEKGKRKGMMRIKKQRMSSAAAYGNRPRTKAEIDAATRKKVEASAKRRAEIAAKKTRVQKANTENARQ